MKTLIRNQIYEANPAEVFHAIDDLGVTGAHMKQSSMMMMGSKLNLEFISKNKTGLGSKYRWTGKMIGIMMDFTVAVTKWIEGKEKIWETIGDTHLIIYSWYRMILKLSSDPTGTRGELSISYEKPKGFLNRIVSFLFADWYCKWCLKKMLGDAKNALNPKKILESVV